MATKTQQYIIGFLTVLLVATGVFITLGSAARIKVDNDKTTFYVPQSEDSSRWVVAGREYSSLYDGSSKLSRRASEIRIDTKVDGDWVTVTRTTPYIRGPTVVDTYKFNSVTKDITQFPVSHTVEVLNGDICSSKSGCIYQYEVRDLVYDGESRDASSPELFGRNMKVEWSEGSYYAKLSQQLVSDKLVVKYRVDESYEKFSVRLFDPPLVDNSKLLVHYQFAGNALDSSSYGNDLTLVGSKIVTNGRFGAGIYFNGSNTPQNNANLANPLYLADNWSLSVWFKPSSDGELYLWGNQAGGRDYFRIRPSLASFIAFRWSSNTTYLEHLPGQIIYENQWTHLSINSENNSCSVRLNGQNMTVWLTSGVNNSFYCGRTEIWSFGSANYVVNWVYNGTLDEIVVYNRSLTESERLQLYNESRKSPKFNLKGVGEQDLSQDGLVFHADMNNRMIDSASGYTISTTSAYRNFTSAGRFQQAYTRGYVAESAFRNTITGLALNDTQFQENLTVSVWINWKDGEWQPGNPTTSRQSFINGWTGYSSGMGWHATNGALSFYGTPGCASSYPGVAVVGWQHLVEVINKTHCIAYVNGVRVDLDARTPGTLEASSNIGIDNAGYFGGYNFIGAIDDTRIYNKSLTADEIKSLYNESIYSTEVAGYGMGIELLNNTDLLAEYHLDGNGLDTSGNDKNATSVIAPKTTAGRFGQAYEFDGIDNSFTAPNVNLSNRSFTFSAWIKPQGTASSAIIHTGGNGVATGGAMLYWVTPGRPNLWIGNSTNTPVYADSGVSPTLNQWHHVVGLFNKSDLVNAEFYIDGVSYYDTYTAQAEIIDKMVNANLGIGSYGSQPTAGNFDGTIDEVKIFGRLLSRSEVLQLYNESVYSNELAGYGSAGVE